MEVLPEPTEKDVLEATRNDCGPLIIYYNVKPDMKGMATAELGKTAVIFNHQSRPSATVLQKHINFMDSKASYKSPGAAGQLHCPRVHQGMLSSILSRLCCATEGTMPMFPLPRLARGEGCFLTKPELR